MIKAFVIIRIKQVYRLLLELGIFRILFVLGLLTFLGFILFMLTSNNEKAIYSALIAPIFFAYIQLKRKDSIFLKTHFAHYKIINWVEYALASLPLIVCFVYHAQWELILLLLMANGVSVQANFSFTRKSVNTVFQRFIPDESFEWKAGVRQFILLFIPLWIAALATSFFIGSVPIAMFIFGISLIGFNEKCEPYQMILAHEKNAVEFLQSKLKNQLKQFTILVLPLIAAYLIFHHAYWYIILAEYAIFLVLHAYFLLSKYAMYESNEKPPGVQLYSTIGTLSIVVPLFIPVVALLTIHFYYKSIDNLNFYLDDFN